MQIDLSIKNNRIANNYAPSPTLPFNVEGKLVEKNGKDIKIEKTIDEKTYEYSLRVKNQVMEKIGDIIQVDKKDIVSYSVEEKKEDLGKDEDINVEKALRDLGLKYTSENVRMIEALARNGIKISKGNVDSYVKSKEYLRKITEGIDIEKTIRLGEIGVNLEDDSLQRISEALDGLEDEKFSIKRFLKIDKDLSYKEAEDISKDLYGQKMGKDVYDSIIALDKEDVPITRENIEKTLDGMKKINDLRSLEDGVYVKFIDGDREFNIDNLYKEKNQYTRSKLQVAKDAGVFEEMTVKAQASIESLETILQELGIEENQENISLLREFIVNDMDMTSERYNRIRDMKNALGELLNISRERGLASIAVEESNLTENIFSVVDKLEDANAKEEDQSLNLEGNRSLTLAHGEDTLKDRSLILKDIEGDRAYSIESLETISDKDLVELIKRGLDFNLKNIAEIKNTGVESLEEGVEYKTVEKTQKILNIFRNLGETLRPDTISKATRIDRDVSLESLELASKEKSPLNIKDAEAINKEKTIFIQNEYIRIKNTLSTNVIKSSIIEGKIIEKMPMADLSPYIEKSLKKYREMDKMTEAIKKIGEKNERLIPMVMKNNLEMTIRELRDIDSFLSGEKDIINTIKNLTNSGKDEDLKEKIEIFQKNISDEIKKGKLSTEDYKELINTMSEGNRSSGENDGREEKDEYFQIKNKISKNDLVFQLPIEIEGDYKTLNVIIPDGKEAIDKNNMNFFVSLDTENIGRVDIDIEVRGGHIYMDLDEEKDLLKPVLDDLKDRFNSIGYSLSKVEDGKIV